MSDAGTQPVDQPDAPSEQQDLDSKEGVSPGELGAGEGAAGDVDTGAPEGTNPANYPDPNIEVSIPNAADCDLLDRPTDSSAGDSKASNGKTDAPAEPGTEAKDTGVKEPMATDNADASGGAAAASAAARGLDLDLPTADSMPTAQSAADKAPAAESAPASAAAPVSGSNVTKDVGLAGLDTSLQEPSSKDAQAALEAGGAAPGKGLTDAASPEVPSISDDAGVENEAGKPNMGSGEVANTRTASVADTIASANKRDSSGSGAPRVPSLNNLTIPSPKGGPSTSVPGKNLTPQTQRGGSFAPSLIDPSGSKGSELKHPPDGSAVFDPEELKTMKGVDGIDPTVKEKYLSAESFQELFGMDGDAFAAQPLWRRQLAKKKVGLF